MRKAWFTALLIFVLVSCSPVVREQGYQVFVHPDGPLYVGDQVSFEIIAPASSSNDTVSVTKNGDVIGSASFAPYGIGQRNQATLWWVWDTSNLESGEQQLEFALESGHTWTRVVRLHSARLVPSPERQAEWAISTSECCTIHYITGTDAARDLESIILIADQQSALVADQMATTLQQKIEITLMDRVIGHGGFTWGGLYISYLDGNYAGNKLDILLHHEFVHYYDGWVGGNYLPSVFQEGLATYLSNGHFKVEPILQRAAALLELEWYIPLENLANDFYNQQHEIGYLEAAALVEYLSSRYGPGVFNEFYRTIAYQEDETVAEMINVALLENMGLSLGTLEQEFITYLGSQDVTSDIRLDLEVTVNYFDTLRRYQRLLDPSAYFLTAWLPDGQVMRERGIVADLIRSPRMPGNLLVEKMLNQSHQAWFDGDYSSAQRTLRWINRFLDFVESKK